MTRPRVRRVVREHYGTSSSVGRGAASEVPAHRRPSERSDAPGGVRRSANKATRSAGVSRSIAKCRKEGSREECRHLATALPL
jgi:hypothetical protein